MTIGISDDPVAWLMHVAAEGGLFKAEGLQVRFRTYPSGKRALNALFNGEVDFATSAEVPVAFGALQEQDFRVLATLGSSDNEIKIVARRGLDLESPAQLAGRTVATQSKSAVHFFLHLFLQKHRLSETTRVRFMKKEDLANALHRGEVDAISTREPFLSQAIAHLGEEALVFEAAGLYRKSSHLSVSGEVLAKDPQTCRAVLRAVIAAEKLLSQDPQRASSLIAGRSELFTQAVDAALKSLDLRVRINQSLIQTLEDTAEWSIGNGLTDKDSVPNFLHYIEPGVLLGLSPDRVALTY